MKPRNNRRKIRNYFLKRNVQMKMIGTNIFYIFSVLLITITAILFPIISFMDPSYSFDVRYQTAKIFIVIAEGLPLPLIAVITLVIIHQLVITHQVCGPLLNFNNTFKKISQCDLARKIILRPHDMLKEEAEHINKMIDGLSRHIVTIKETHHKLICALDETAAKSSDTGERQSFEASLKTAQKQARLIEKYLAVFVLSDEYNEKLSC